MTVSADFRIHPKNKEAVFIPTFRRNTASCNKDVSSLAFVPPLDDGLRDKVCLLQCGTAALSEDRDLNITKLKEGIPGLCYYLDRFKIPKRMTVRGWCPCPLCITESETPAKRFGFMAYHNPELVETIMSISPDEMLWGILTQVLWKSGDADKEQIGTAEEIEQLVDGTSFKQAKDRLLTFPGAFSTFLGLLASNRKGRVVKLSTRGRVRWVLTRPVY